MDFDTEYIQELAKILKDNELTEISLENEEGAITIRKDVILQGGSVLSSPVLTQTANKLSDTAVESKENKGTPIVSPMVGTFYKAPSPEDEPFVKVGQTIKKGDKVCIIEAMKLMNEIETEIEGKIVEICVQDGDPVEFGQVLMYVE